MDTDPENATQTPPLRYRRMGESAMKKVVILGGSVILCILFILIITVSSIDTEWNRMEQLISLGISSLGLMIFLTIIISYIIFHVRKGRRENLQSNTITNDVDDNPPTYEEIMGKLPSYDSYSKSTARKVSTDESCHYVCHV